VIEATHERGITLGHIRLRIRHPADPTALFAAIPDDQFAADERIPYWAEVWPAAVALGRRLIASDLRGLRAVELGAGVALAGLAAAHAGADVLVTDYEPAALDFARQNAELNGLRISTACLDWRDPDWPRGFDLVLAADILYEARNVAPVARLIPELLAPQGKAWIADPGRPYAGDFRQALAEQGLSVTTGSMSIFWDGRGRSVDLLTVERAGQVTGPSRVPGDRRARGRHREWPARPPPPAAR
jgi:predicted nicotinamide N-methyase